MRFVRYVGVQVLAYAVDLGGFLALVHLGVAGPVVANLVCKACAGLFAFTVHRMFTFGIRGSSSRATHAVRYFALLAVNTPLSSAILAALLEIIPLVSAAKILADVLTVALSYVLTARVVFAQSRVVARGKSYKRRPVSE